MGEKLNKKSYGKPKMKFVSARADQAVANTCWGGHGNSMTWYYDTKGHGYVSFQIGGGKCTLNLDRVTYYEYKDEPGKALYDGEKYRELNEALRASGGESGNPFKGEGVDFPTRPDPSWS